MVGKYYDEKQHEERAGDKNEEAILRDPKENNLITRWEVCHINLVYS